MTAEDQFNEMSYAYTGTVHFSTSDTGSGVSLPADYTFVSGDDGVHVFTSGLTLVTPGSQTVTAADTLNSSIAGSAVIVVNPILLSIPSNLSGGRGSIVTVPIIAADLLDAANGNSGLSAGTFVVVYNPNLFTVSAGDVQLGSLPSPSTGWNVTTNTPTPGLLIIALQNNGAGVITTTGGGSLVTMNFHIKAMPSWGRATSIWPPTMAARRPSPALTIKICPLHSGSAAAGRRRAQSRLCLQRLRSRRRHRHHHGRQLAAGRCQRILQHHCPGRDQPIPV